MQLEPTSQSPAPAPSVRNAVVVVGLWGRPIAELPPRCAELFAAEPLRLVELDGAAEEPIDTGSVDVVLVWLDRYVGPSELELIARDLRAESAGAALLCYAPTAGQSFCETALSVGVDDVMAGRSWPRELVSRVKALARRSRRSSPRSAYLRFGPVRLDAAQHRLWVEGSSTQLTPIETRLLAELIRAQGSPRSREQLLASAWGDDSLETSDRAVDNAILRLRRKLVGLMITTVRGVGFRLDLVG